MRTKPAAPKLDKAAITIHKTRFNRRARRPKAAAATGRYTLAPMLLARQLALPAVGSRLLSGVAWRRACARPPGPLRPLFALIVARNRGASSTRVDHAQEERFPCPACEASIRERLLRQHMTRCCPDALAATLAQNSGGWPGAEAASAAGVAREALLLSAAVRLRFLEPAARAAAAAEASAAVLGLGDAPPSLGFAAIAAAAPTIPAALFTGSNGGHRGSSDVDVSGSGSGEEDGDGDLALHLRLPTGMPGGVLPGAPGLDEVAAVLGIPIARVQQASARARGRHAFSTPSFFRNVPCL